MVDTLGLRQHRRLQAAVLAGLAVSVFPRCTIGPTSAASASRDGLPPLSPIELVMHRKSQGISDAAEQLAQHIARELGDARRGN